MSALTRTCALLALIFAVGACAPTTFIISKNGKASYFGSERPSTLALLCDGGDLRAILNETSIPAPIKDDIYIYDCTEKRSKDMVISLFTFLSPEEKAELKKAFNRHDYIVNYVQC